MHEMSNGPMPPEGSGPSLEDITEATKPDLSCFSDAEQAELGEAVHGVLHAIKGPGFLFELAMNNFVKLGAHKVGHGLQTMIWSAAQTMMLIHGIKGQDLPLSMVSIINQNPNATEADVAVCEMAQEFTQATLAGAHHTAMDTWRDWVETLGQDDWELYTDGIALLLRQALDISTGTLQDSEMGSAVLGAPAVQLVPRDEKPKEF